MVGKKILPLTLIAVGLMVPNRLWSLGNSPDLPIVAPVAQDSLRGQGLDALAKWKDKDQLRRERNSEDFRQLKLVDSVGWLKVNAIKRPDESTEQLQKERTQRKVSALKEFCGGARFEKLAEVDSIKQMTAEERTFCKERIRLSNPMIP